MIAMEALGIVWDAILSPMGQLFLWGAITIWCFAVSLYLLGDYRNDGNARVGGAGALTILWMFNAYCWFTLTEVNMLFTDAIMCGMFFYWAFKTFRKWCLDVGFAYLLAFVLDYAYMRELDYTVYAWLSNTVYVFQLYVITRPGWRMILTKQASLYEQQWDATSRARPSTVSAGPSF